MLISKIPLGDVTTNTSGDAERIQRIKDNGLACLSRLHGDVTWEDWMGVGAALKLITEETLVETDAIKWDPDNKRMVKEFSQRWEEYESGAGRNHKPLTPTERWALREVMSNPEISAWRSTLTGPEKRRLNHPNAVLNRFRAQRKTKASPAEDCKPSPQAKLKAANIELQEELHRMKKHGDGNVFTKNDTPKTIASVVIHTFDGLNNKTAKVEAVARELNTWIKQQKISAL